MRAFAFGIVLAASIGPVALLIMTNSLRFGLASGLQSAVGAACADLTYAVLAATVGVGITGVLSAHAREIHFAGSLMLTFYGAYMAIQAVGARNDASEIEQYPTSPRVGPLPATYALTVVNPLTVIIFGGFIAQLPPELAEARLVSVVISLFMGSLAVQLGMALGAALIGARIRDDRWIRRLNLLSGFGIIAFGMIGLF